MALYDDCIAYWNFNEGTGTLAEDTKGANDGTLVGAGVTWLGAGLGITPGGGGANSGNAVSFDGTARVTVGAMADIKGIQKLTISAWVKRNSANGIIFMLRESAISQNIALLFGSGGLYFAPYSFATDASFADVYDNTWKHYCVVFDGSQADNAGRVKMYVNGLPKTLAFTGIIPALTSAPDDIATIGGEIALGGLYDITGSIDEVGIWNRALSSGEVASLYRAIQTELFNDSVGISDSFTKRANIIKNDTLSLADSRSKQANIAKSNDSVSFADSHLDTILRDRQVHTRIHIKKIWGGGVLD